MVGDPVVDGNLVEVVLAAMPELAGPYQLSSSVEPELDKAELLTELLVDCFMAPALAASGPEAEPLQRAAALLEHLVENGDEAVRDLVLAGVCARIADVPWLRVELAPVLGPRTRAAVEAWAATHPWTPPLPRDADDEPLRKHTVGRAFRRHFPDLLKAYIARRELYRTDDDPLGEYDEWPGHGFTLATVFVESVLVPEFGKPDPDAERVQRVLDFAERMLSSDDPVNVSDAEDVLTGILAHDGLWRAVLPYAGPCTTEELWLRGTI